MRRAKQLLRYKYQKGDYGVSSVDKYVLLCKESRLCNAKNLRNCMTAALAGVGMEVVSAFAPPRKESTLRVC